MIMHSSFLSALFQSIQGHEMSLSVEVFEVKMKSNGSIKLVNAERFNPDEMEKIDVSASKKEEKKEVLVEEKVEDAPKGKPGKPRLPRKA
jgi:hypothetical protein